MADSSALLADLRRLAAAPSGLRAPRAEGDGWPVAGLTPAQLHEIYADDVQDDAAAIGFAVAVALAGGALPLLWIRTEGAARGAGRLLAAGLAELGLPPEALMLVAAADEAALLRAAADAARCPGLGTVLVESRGRMAGLDLTATRRLMLAAEEAGTTVLSVRLAAEPVPSAAATRWRVAAAESTPLPANAPGRPAFRIECLRRRGGAAGPCGRVEWNRDSRCFVPPPVAGAAFIDAPLSGAGLSVAAGGAAAQRPAASVRRTG